MYSIPAASSGRWSHHRCCSPWLMLVGTSYGVAWRPSIGVVRWSADACRRSKILDPRQCSGCAFYAGLLSPAPGLWLR